MSAVLASITAGMANSTMNDVTTCAHTKIGIRFSVIPGARSLSAVVISETATASDRDFGERNELRPDVGALARRVERFGERRIREPARRPVRRSAETRRRERCRRRAASSS